MRVNHSLISCFLCKNFHVFQHPLSFTDKSFDIIAITESKLETNISTTNNLSIKIYSFEFEFNLQLLVYCEAPFIQNSSRLKHTQKE